MRLIPQLLAAAGGLVLSAAAFAADPQVKLKTTMGDIVVELDQEHAPISTDNFLKYVKSGFYNGTVFHRVIDGFMIQAGGYDKNLKSKPTRKPIKNEAGNGLSNAAYTLAMARQDDADSATSQFFINVADNAGLDRANRVDAGYTVFGKVVEGQEVVDKIKGVVVDDKPGFQNVPVVPVVITSATVVKK
ncbi:peptidyl-prolyl cis-trans isomerase [Massilia arenosa]|uniref:Peptidyl-prolyl cis-trans isomerase n=1 Tax=Zemynaea arenosa TaxID=2561931 RepID=A0A4Y9SGE8_9BURK|nr:peptidylprolyl isomerase [Massilia arenosa]TFW23137.1 peptidyl-prolyl cis-trans isomerase [Massilia arenosa]